MKPVVRFNQSTISCRTGSHVPSFGEIKQGSGKVNACRNWISLFHDAAIHCRVARAGFCLSYVSSDKISKMKLKTQIINYRLSIRIHKYHSWAVQAMMSLTSMMSCRHCVLMSQCCCILLLLQVSASRLNDLETLQHAGRQRLLHHELWHPALNMTYGKTVKHVLYMCSHGDDNLF